MELICRLIVITAGLWLVCVSLLMAVRPEFARRSLRKFASTNLINYTELSLRLIAGLGFYGLAAYSPYEAALKVGGGFLAITAIILMLVPRQWHHYYAQWWADKLRPWQVRLCAPFSFIFGLCVIGLAVS